MLATLSIVALTIWLKGALAMGALIITCCLFLDEQPQRLERPSAFELAAGILLAMVWPVSFPWLVRGVVKDLPRE